MQVGATSQNQLCQQLFHFLECSVLIVQLKEEMVIPPNTPLQKGFIIA